jgi:hypothetical protein
LATFALITVNYYVDDPSIKSAASSVTSWGSLLVAVAVGLALISLVKFQWREIQARADQWYFRVWTLIILFVTIISGFIPLQYPFGQGPYYNWLYFNITMWLDMTFYSCIGLMIASATYRIFRIRRSIASLILLVSCYAIILWNVGFYKPAGEWIMAVPRPSAMRALLMAGALGTMGLGIRALLGRERGIG